MSVLFTNIRFENLDFCLTNRLRECDIVILGNTFFDLGGIFLGVGLFFGDEEVFLGIFLGLIKI